MIAQHSQILAKRSSVSTFNFYIITTMIKFTATNLHLQFLRNREVRVMIIANKEEYDNIKDIHTLPDGVFIVNVEKDFSARFQGYNIIPKLPRSNKKIEVHIDISDDQYDNVKEFPTLSEGQYIITITPDINDGASFNGITID